MRNGSAGSSPPRFVAFSHLPTSTTARALSTPRTTSQRRLVKLRNMLNSRCPSPSTSAKACAENRSIATRSPVSEYQRKHDHDDRRPYGVHGQIGDLPSLQRGKRAPVTHEARIEPRRPRQVDEQNEVLAKSRHSVGSEAKLGDAGGDRRERHAIDHECADHEQELQAVEEVGRGLRISRGGGV